MKFKDIIKAHLDKMAEQDQAFAIRYNDKSKTLDKCIQYIFTEAQKQREGNCAAIEDAVVFGWAVHYYQEDNLKIDTNAQADVKHTAETKPIKPTKHIKPVKALVKDNSDTTKCRQLDLFEGF